MTAGHALTRMAGGALYDGHLLVKRWPEMAAKIQKRLLSEGKITKEMIESYVDAYDGIYGDDTDAYVEEIIADTYAGMNRTDNGTNQLRADVKMEVGQWQKKSGSARAPPAGNKWSAGYDPETASIKDQLRNSIDELNRMNVVASIQTPTKFTSKSAAAKWAVNLLAKYGGKVDRQGYGEIYFSPKDINKAVDYADTNEEKAAVAAVPMVLKRGKEIGGHQNHKGREKQTITFAAPVALNGQRGNMAVVVNKNGNHYYTHRIVTPDGRTFVFNKEDAAQEPSRGVTVSGSLADTTSAASKASISKTGETVKGKMSAQDGRYRDLMGEKAAQYVRRLESGLVNELAENLSVPGQAKRKNSLSKNRRENFSFARYPNNAMDKHDMFGAVHTWHPRDDSNVRPFA